MRRMINNKFSICFGIIYVFIFTSIFGYLPALADSEKLDLAGSVNSFISNLLIPQAWAEENDENVENVEKENTSTNTCKEFTSAHETRIRKSFTVNDFKTSVLDNKIRSPRDRYASDIAGRFKVTQTRDLLRAYIDAVKEVYENKKNIDPAKIIIGNELAPYTENDIKEIKKDEISDARSLEKYLQLVAYERCKSDSFGNASKNAEDCATLVACGQFEMYPFFRGKKTEGSHPHVSQGIVASPEPKWTALQTLTRPFFCHLKDKNDNAAYYVGAGIHGEDEFTKKEELIKQFQGIYGGCGEGDTFIPRQKFDDIRYHAAFLPQNKVVAFSDGVLRASSGAVLFETLRKSLGEGTNIIRLDLSQKRIVDEKDKKKDDDPPTRKPGHTPLRAVAEPYGEEIKGAISFVVYEEPKKDDKKDEMKIDESKKDEPKPKIHSIRVDDIQTMLAKYFTYMRRSGTIPPLGHSALEGKDVFKEAVEFPSDVEEILNKIFMIEGSTATAERGSTSSSNNKGKGASTKENPFKDDPGLYLNTVWINILNEINIPIITHYKQSLYDVDTKDHPIYNTAAFKLLLGDPGEFRPDDPSSVKGYRSLMYDPHKQEVISTFNVFSQIFGGTDAKSADLTERYIMLPPIFDGALQNKLKVPSADLFPQIDEAASMLSFQSNTPFPMPLTDLQIGHDFEGMRASDLIAAYRALMWAATLTLKNECAKRADITQEQIEGATSMETLTGLKPDYCMAIAVAANHIQKFLSESDPCHTDNLLEDGLHFITPSIFHRCGSDFMNWVFWIVVGLFTIQLLIWVFSGNYWFWESDAWNCMDWQFFRDKCKREEREKAKAAKIQQEENLETAEDELHQKIPTPPGGDDPLGHL